MPMKRKQESLVEHLMPQTDGEKLMALAAPIPYTVAKLTGYGVMKLAQIGMTYAEGEVETPTKTRKTGTTGE